MLAPTRSTNGAPQLQVIPNRTRLAEVGLSESEVGAMVEAALGGRFASEFVDGKEEMIVFLIKIPPSVLNWFADSTVGQSIG
jgi:Cu/Ag efflux pump CusA